MFKVQSKRSIFVQANRETVEAEAQQVVKQYPSNNRSMVCYTAQ